MVRECYSCQRYLSGDSFSRNQWFKGEGYSRCRDCVEDGIFEPTFQCRSCSRQFRNQNELNMHMQVHRPRNVACPVCGDTRFKSGANAVQHVESGYCSGRPGRQNAREQIYKFSSTKGGMRRYMNDVPQLTNGSHFDEGVPDFPYRCPGCSKAFRHLSQLLQHQDQKHNNRKLIGY